jgi:hypothetical protein
VKNTEQAEFFRSASDAIYLRGTVIALLGFNPDTATPDQIRTALIQRLQPSAATAALEAKDCKIADLVGKIQDLQQQLSDAKDYAETLEIASQSRAEEIRLLRATIDDAHRVMDESALAGARDTNHRGLSDRIRTIISPAKAFFAAQLAKETAP